MDMNVSFVLRLSATECNEVICITKNNAFFRKMIKLKRGDKIVYGAFTEVGNVDIFSIRRQC